MKSLSRLAFLLLISALLAAGCKKSGVPADPGKEQPLTAEQQSKLKATQTLQAYYQALEAENLDPNQFFAPIVEQFFNSANLTPAQIGEMLNAGFSNSENRKVSLQMDAMEFQPTPDGGYVAIFDGEQSYVRTMDRSEVSESFRNQVTFNSDFKIVAYQSLTASGRGVGQRALGVTAVGPMLIEKLRAGQADVINNYIDPKRGLIFVVQPGAFRTPYFVRTAEDMFAAQSVLKNKASFSCAVKLEAIPSFSCEEGFSKEGCFLGSISDFKGFSELMKALNDSGAGQYDAAELAKAAELEGFISMKLVDTKSGISLYFGQIDGQWRLLAVDTAEYECAA